MSKTIGIDLGATNACVAVTDRAKTAVVPNCEGDRTTPAIVYFPDSGPHVVGAVAKRRAITAAAHIVSSIKRFIGRPFDSPEFRTNALAVGYSVVEADNGEAWVQVRDKCLSPQEIASTILAKMKTAAEDYVGQEVTQAVVAVPTYFDDAQRRAVKDAGRIAGLNVLQLLDEPTAAALAYGLNDKKHATVAVYDLGGGTFDISILRIDAGQVEVLATNGDRHLGGDDFNLEIVDLLADRFMLDNDGLDLRQDKMALQRLMEAAEKAKHELSASVATDVNLPFITADAAGPKHLNETITRQRLEQTVEHLVQRTLPPCRTALSDADLDVRAIDEVLLVGGQTRMPRIQQVVGEFFGKKPTARLNPDEVVAIGAATQAALQDVRHHRPVSAASVGLETSRGVFTPIIRRDTPIPAKKSMVLSTARDNQSTIDVHVLQGELAVAADNKTVGRLQLIKIAPAARGVPQIEVTFEVDANGLVLVAAQDLGTSTPHPLRVLASPRLSDEEVARINREARAAEYAGPSRLPNRYFLGRLPSGISTRAVVDPSAREGARKETSTQVQRDTEKQKKMNSQKSTLETTRDNFAYAARVAGAQVLLDKLVDVTVSHLRKSGVDTSFTDSPLGRSLVKIALPTVILAGANTDLVGTKLDSSMLKTVRGLAEIAQLAATLEGANVLARLAEPLLTELLTVRDALPPPTQRELDELLAASEPEAAVSSAT